MRHCLRWVWGYAAKADCFTRPGRTHCGRRLHYARVRIQSSNRVGLPAFGAVGMKQKIVKVPKYEVGVASLLLKPPTALTVGFKTSLQSNNKTNNPKTGKASFPLKLPTPFRVSNGKNTA